jgi:hypothetical protein
MVCLEHLIEHDRLVERDRQQIEQIRDQLRRFRSVYVSLLNDDQLRLDYERKRHEHQRIMFDVECLLTNQFDDIERIRAMTDRLRQAMEQQRTHTGDSPSK